MTFFSISLYAAALLAANISAATFGPWITPINSFFFIGLDLALRDLLQERLKGWKMALVIIFSSGLSWFASIDAGMIAIAGAISFCLANMVDWFIFSKTKGKWARRANISNTGGAAVDSIMFPMIAFGSLLPGVVLGQFLAKTVGAAFWVKVIELFLIAKRGE